MPCYTPISAWRSKVLNKNGKRPLVFNIRDAYVDMPVKVPCGQCIGCRLERSRQWAIRCVHEASMHEENCFITLTYSDEYLPKNGSLDVEVFKKFMKRFRKAIGNRKIKYFHCGEYGEKLGRPHYHACIFGYDFKDKKLQYNGNNSYYVSSLLSRLWPYGYHVIGDITFESSAYVARYVTKKLSGKEIEKYNGKKPEYATMSLKTAIGAEWYDKYKNDVYSYDSVVMREKEMKPPKYYDRKYELEFPEKMKYIKANREDLPDRVLERTEERALRLRHKFRKERQKLLERRYEKC